MKVFLSYRRDDTGGRAGRLFDVLVARFGVRDVFQDVTTVAPGLDFTAQIEAAIETSDVVLVVIGPSWLGDSDPMGGRRIDRADDFVRQEVSRALASGIPVVPVLVEGASLPPADELPDDLASLVLRQAVTLRDVSWHSDVDDLIRRLEGDHRLATRRPRRWPIIAGAGLSVVVAVAVVTVIARRGDDGGSSDDSGDGSVVITSPISLPAVEFGPTWQGARTCAGGGRIELSAGPVTLVGDIMTAAFVVTAHGLETETHFGSIRVVDDHGRPYDEVDAGELNGGFTLEQEGEGTERTTELSMNRDLRTHPDSDGIVLIVTGECTDDPILLPVTVPSS